MFTANVEAAVIRGEKLNQLDDKSQAMNDAADQLVAAAVAYSKRLGVPVTPIVDYSQFAWQNKGRDAIREALVTYEAEISAKRRLNQIKLDELVYISFDLREAISIIDEGKTFAEFFQKWNICKRRFIVKTLMGLRTKSHPVVAIIEHQATTIMNNQPVVIDSAPASLSPQPLSTAVKDPTRIEKKRPASIVSLSRPKQKPTTSSTQLVSQKLETAIAETSEAKFLTKAKVQLNYYWMHLTNEGESSRWFYPKEPLQQKVGAMKDLWANMNDFDKFKSEWEKARTVLAQHRPFTLFGCIKFSFTRIFGFKGNTLVKDLDQNLAELNQFRLAKK
jgi:hypothetical protein